MATSGGVRSLLAKFENSNNNNSNPDVSPSRGRPSDDMQDNATNRPLSKVRASFVSVERNGQGSPTPGALRRTESYNTDADSNQRSVTVSPTRQLETASASPFSPSPHKIRTALAAFQGDRVESVTAKLASLATKDNGQPPMTAEKPETMAEKMPETKKSETKPSLLEPANIEKSVSKSTPAASTKQAAPSKAIKKSASAMSIAKESSINKNPTKSAATKDQKPASTPTRSATTASRLTAHSDKPTGTRTTAVRSSATTARTERSSTPSHEATKKPAVQPSPRTKSSSKSPTRSVRLPASLVTPTAASAARTGTLARSQSHVNLRSSPKAEPAKTLSRKPSTLRSDTSRLANHTIPDRPKSRVSTASSRAPAEESFLARMMRPTASSASKMHDKIEPRSPPRLAKAAKLSPKKDAPAKIVEDKKEKHQQSVKNVEPKTPEAKNEKVSTNQPVVKEEIPVENGHQAKESAAPVVEEAPKEAEIPVTACSSNPVVPALVESIAEPASEPVVEEPKANVATVESLTEPYTKLTENPQTEFILPERADAIAGESLESVTETVSEEQKVDVKDDSQAISTEPEHLRDKEHDSIGECTAEAIVPQEKVSDKTEEVPESHESETTEPEETAVEETTSAAVDAIAESVQKVEEPSQNASTNQPLDSTTEQTEEETAEL